MPDGTDATSQLDSPSSSVGTTTAAVVTPDDGEDSSSVTPNEAKDPRKYARNYQLELCQKALEENIIVYLGTGCGKTHIAILLMYELRHLIMSPQKRVCIFLAPTVALVNQQAKAIEETIDFKVGVYCGTFKDLKKHCNWEKEIEQYEVYSVEDNVDLEQFVASPVVKVYTYGPVANSTLIPYENYGSKLEELKRQCISELGKSDDHQSFQSLRNAKSSLCRMHDNINYCLENLGLWGALQVASHLIYLV